MGRHKRQTMSDEESSQRAREFRERIRHQFQRSIGDVTGEQTWHPDSDGRTADWPKGTNDHGTEDAGKGRGN